MAKTARKKRSASDRIGRRRKQIIAAAALLFSNNGFYETDVEDIARLAGIAKGTIYNYFDDKRDLFMSAVAWGQERLISKIDEATRGMDDPALKLETAMQTYLSFFQRNRHLYRLIFLHRNAYRDKTELRFTKKYLAHRYAFENILREGIEAGILKNVNVHIVSFAISGIIHALYHNRLFHRDSMAPASDISLAKELVFNGLLEKEADAAGPRRHENRPSHPHQ
jgi:AcrR family transcriptional regulator